LSRTRRLPFEPSNVIVTARTFPTRYLVNDACVLLGKPNASGRSSDSKGRRRCSRPKEGPCYRCLYPEPPPPGLVPSCAEGGVLGVAAGILASSRRPKREADHGDRRAADRRFLIYDALRMKVRELKLRKDPDCPVCGRNPTVTKLIDYEQFWRHHARRAGAGQSGTRN